MRTIMVLNAKGGCGKTTLATNLAAYYAQQNKAVVLADLDPQGSAIAWLAARPEGRPTIRGVAAWREALRVPRNTEYVILDAPPGRHGRELTALVRRAQSIVIPVLPSPIDIRAAAHFVHEILLQGRVTRRETRLAVVANRVRENPALQGAMERMLNSVNIPYTSANTAMYHKLQGFLSHLKVPFIATLRDTVNYQLADEQGIGIHELPESQVTNDLAQWEPLIAWLDSRRSLPRPA